MKRVLLVFVVLLGVLVFMTGVAFAEGEDEATTAVETGATVDEATADDATADDATADETATDDATTDDATADDAAADDAAADDATADDTVTAVPVDAEVPVDDLSFKVLLDGELVGFEAFGVEPQIVNGRIIVPLRAVFEMMGATVDWDNETRTVTATKGDTVVILAIDSTTPTVNGEVVELDQPAIIINDRTMAPLRFVAEAFGGDVEWNEVTRTASITMPVEAVEEEATEEEATEEEAADEGDATDGEAADGEAADGEAADGDAADGEAADDEAADGETAEDEAA